MRNEMLVYFYGAGLIVVFIPLAFTIVYGAETEWKCYWSGKYVECSSPRHSGEHAWKWFDSDGGEGNNGINEYTPGYVVQLKTNILLRDFCIDEKTLVEYYLDPEIEKAKFSGNPSTLIDIKCPKGFICRDGACIPSAEERRFGCKGYNEICQQNSDCCSGMVCMATESFYRCRFFDQSGGSNTCTDSDFGKNLYQKGKTRIPEEGIEFTDRCEGNTLVEFFCTPYREIRSERIACTYGCSDGACIKGGEGSCNLEGERCGTGYRNCCSGLACLWDDLRKIYKCVKRGGAPTPTPTTPPPDTPTPRPPRPPEIKITIYAGWNQISSPAGTLNFQSLVANSECSGVRGPYFYDATTNSYRTGEFIEEMLGYWVYSGNSCEFSVSGTYSGGSLRLNKGWNMISSSKSWNEIKGNCVKTSSIWHWNGRGYVKIPESQNMNRRNGYWVRVSGNCRISE